MIVIKIEIKMHLNLQKMCAALLNGKTQIWFHDVNSNAKRYVVYNINKSTVSSQFHLF